MTNLTKVSALVLGAALLTLTACSSVASAHPKEQVADKPAKHQMMDGEHKDMKKMEHDMMSKMDMSKLSPECKTMMTKMKTKMAEKHGDSDMKEHDMSKKEGHDMSKMEDHGSDEMKAKMATHKKCMAEMEEATPHEH